MQPSSRETRIGGARLAARSLIAAALLAAGLMTATPASAEPVSASERMALSARMLQTELMVAALSCDANARYNAFVHKFEDQLVSHGRALRGLFQRHFGAAGTARLTTFVTRLANQASLRSARAGADYCKGAARLFETTLQVPENAFAGYVAQQPFAEAHDIDAVLNAAVRQVTKTTMAAAGTDGTAKR